MPAHLSRGLIAAVLLVAATVPALRAQQLVRRWERPGFDFRPDGVWRPRARSVRQTRQAALARRDLDALNAPLRGASALRAAAGAPIVPTAFAVTGTLRVPVFLGRYLNSPDTTVLYTRQLYDDVLFSQTPPLGLPFTIRTFYEQMSNGLLSVQGQVVGWVNLDSNDTFYQGADQGGQTCNGLCGNSRVAQFLREALQKSDGSLDFGQFDNDGPDGQPNSPDDDGFVDLATFIHPEVGGECGPSTGNVWAHRFVLSGWGGGSFTTNDQRRDGGGTPIPGQFIRVDDYTIQSGLGGTTSCDGGAIMPVGTIAHETGHGLGLPDLYDTNPFDGDDSEGIGNWGLMSSGNYTSPFSPSHMEGFSRFELGWVMLRDLTLNGTYTIGAYPSADTIFRITPTVANPRTEYFLIENRQGVLGDSALIRFKGPGLLIWHVDRMQYTNGFFSNTVNSGTIHGLWLMQADGANQLRSSTAGVRNRGDAGDPYPGTAGNTVFGAASTPSAFLNTGTYAGFAIDSIRQVVPGGEMAFRLRFGFPYTYAVSGNGTVATSPSTVSGAFVTQGDSVDLTAVPGTGAVFAGWTGDTSSASLTLRLRATRPWSVTATFQIPLAVQDSALRGGVVGVAYSDTVRVSGGSGSYTFVLASNGQALPNGLTLGASTGVISGLPTRDSTWNFTVVVTSGGQPPLNLPVRIVVSAPQLAAQSVVDQLLLGGTRLTADEIRYLDILGNNNNGLDVGDVLAWLDDTGTALPAPLAARLFGRLRR